MVRSTVPHIADSAIRKSVVEMTARFRLPTSAVLSLLDERGAGAISRAAHQVMVSWRCSSRRLSSGQRFAVGTYSRVRIRIALVKHRAHSSIGAGAVVGGCLSTVIGMIAAAVVGNVETWVVLTAALRAHVRCRRTFLLIISAVACYVPLRAPVDPLVACGEYLSVRSRPEVSRSNGLFPPALLASAT